MVRLTSTLVCVALCYLVTADQPWVEPGQGCVYDISAYKVGETFNRECDDCTCLVDGSVACVKNKNCCLYAGSNSETLRAEIGDSFFDGCNQCTCAKSRKNRGPWACTKKMCSCRYKNWDKVWGYATSGDVVGVWDPKGDRQLNPKGDNYGCTKACTCEAKKSGKKEKVDCRDEPCVAV